MLGVLKKLLGVEDLTPVYARGPRIIDVRSAAEFAQGHVPGAENIPLDRISSAAKTLKTEKRPIVLCCASGNRSGQATRLLRDQGLSDVHNGGSWMSVRRQVG